jgi:CRP-like cAMP-binding protein
MSISADAVDALVRSGAILTVPRSTILSREGRVARECHLVIDGYAEVSRDGTVIGRLGPGSYIGDLALLHEEPRARTVTARTPMRVIATPIALFVHWLDAYPDARKALANQQRSHT